MWLAAAGPGKATESNTNSGENDDYLATVNLWTDRRLPLMNDNNSCCVLSPIESLPRTVCHSHSPRGDSNCTRLAAAAAGAATNEVWVICSRRTTCPRLNFARVSPRPNQMCVISPLAHSANGQETPSQEEYQCPIGHGNEEEDVSWPFIRGSTARRLFYK